MSDEGKRKPALRIVSENDREDIDSAAAMCQVEATLRELAANIIRVVRGAGKPCNIMNQCTDFVNAVDRYHDQAGVWPSDWDINQALSIHRELSLAEIDIDWEREAIYEAAMRGSLQVAASRLAGQRVQEQRAESQVLDAVKGLMQHREKAQKHHMESQKKTGQPASGKGTRPKKDNTVVLPKSEDG